VRGRRVRGRGARRRLVAAVVFAGFVGTVVGTVARAGDASGSLPLIPSLPRLSQVSSACPIPVLYRPAFVDAAEQTNLPLAMLVAVAQVESQFSADARSSAGARGLLQVLPATGALLSLDVNRPETNVLAGARYLRLLLDEFHSTDLAFAAYNAGPTAVARAGGAPTADTAAYVAKIDAIRRDLRGCR
jgi:peptidoglycan DL-endopeptidase CwlO